MSGFVGGGKWLSPSEARAAFSVRWPVGRRICGTEHMTIRIGRSQSLGGGPDPIRDDLVDAEYNHDGLFLKDVVIECVTATSQFRTAPDQER
jgi:hypothetical protein